MNNIKLEELSPEQKKNLVKELKEEQKQLRKLRQQNKETLRNLEDGLVDDNIAFCIERRQNVEELINKLFLEAKTIIELRSELYGEEKANQDSHTFTKTDGSAQIRIGWNSHPTFNGTEGQGLIKIKRFMSSLAGDTKNEQLLMEFLNTALKTDAQGNLNPREVRKLNSLRNKANSALFNEGMDIINESIQEVRTSMYIRGFKMTQKENEPPKRVDFQFSIR